MKERWIPIAGYESLYEVSNQGRVRRIGRAKGAVPGRILRPRMKESGHVQVSLSRNAVEIDFHVHALVLEAFVGPRPEGLEGCHGGGDPTNNCAENLRWGTHAENMADMLRHGRNANANKATCPRGHALIHPNLVVSQWRDGRRTCLACARAKTWIRRKGGNLQEVSDRYYSEIIALFEDKKEEAA